MNKPKPKESWRCTVVGVCAFVGAMFLTYQLSAWLADSTGVVWTVLPITFLAILLEHGNEHKKDLQSLDRYWEQEMQAKDAEWQQVLQNHTRKPEQWGG